LPGGRTVALPAVMGILNVTPDSFSDGGKFDDPHAALDHALAMEADGAAIIDVGVESTRPFGARSVPIEVELQRITPVLRLLGPKLRIPVSIDTRKAGVARAAIDLGATIVNDVSAMTSDPAMAELVAASGCTVILMHMRGGPEDHIAHTHYGDVVREVIDYLSHRASAALTAGIPRERIVLDPGLGFSKQPAHSVAVLGGLSRLCALGYPVLVGASRKGFIRKFAGDSASALATASAVVNAFALARGATLFRVHDVAPTLAALSIVRALKSGFAD